MNEYMANEYGLSNDELKHWKYIKRVKKNGKWVYYYDNETDSKYANNVSELNATETVALDKKGNLDIVSDYNKVSSNRTDYKDTDRLFSKTTVSENVKTVKGLFNEKIKTKDTVITKERGKIERAAAKGEKWLYKKVFKKLNK